MQDAPDGLKVNEAVIGTVSNLFAIPQIKAVLLRIYWADSDAPDPKPTPIHFQEFLSDAREGLLEENVWLHIAGPSG